MSKRGLTRFIVYASFFLFSAAAFGQEYTVDETLNWQITTKTSSAQGPAVGVLWIKGAPAMAGNPLVPQYSRQIALSGNGQIQAELTETQYVPADIPTSEQVDAIMHAMQNRQVVSTSLVMQAGKSLGFIRVFPFRVNPENFRIERLQQFTLHITQDPALPQTRAKSGVTTSRLASGTWYKFGVTETGIYKLDHNFLQSVGIGSSADARNIQVYGKGGGMLPMANNARRDEDLVENAVEVVDVNGNNKIDNEDYILMYARGPVSWKLNPVTKQFNHQINYYSDTSYYFITVAAAPGKRITVQPSESGTNYTEVTKFDAYAYHEQDMLNEVKRYVNSGRQWLGEEFHSMTGQKTIEKDFSFNIPQLDPAEDIHLKTGLAARAGLSSTFQFFANGQEVLKTNMDAAYVSDYLAAYVTTRTAENVFKNPSPQIDLKLRYNVPPTEASGWLDYIELNTRAQLRNTGGQFGFRDQNSVQAGTVNRYHIGNGNASLQVWDVTDFHGVKKQTTQLQGSELVFASKGDELREYVAFDGTAFLSPAAFGRITNQDLHGLEQPDMIIVAHQSLLQAANRLADFHRGHDDFVVQVVTPQQIYNEFSSGTQDISAIRDFVRMFYERGAGGGRMPKYLLLFGDGSWDYKYRADKNTNLVPTYESLNSIEPESTYCADDFYGFLDPIEGDWDYDPDIELTDIAIGRIPAGSSEEANAMVDKILKYHEPSTLNDWRNDITFVADDENGNAFFNQSEAISKMVEKETNQFNLSKIYLDAYKQEASPSGARYPAAQRDIINTFAQGALVIDYLGHGGEVGLAHEKVLEVPDIEAMRNIDRMPLFLTATCEFSRYDDPYRESAGEYTFLNPKGGAIAMFTTTRVAWIGTNEELNENVLINNLFKKENGKAPRIGDVCMRAKNNMGHPESIRSFTLLGDPAIRLAMPEDKVVITSINGKSINDGGDTLRALEKATMTGEIWAFGQTQVDPTFNGVVDVTIYDKKTKKSTLGNDPDSDPADFQVRESIIYKGRASVKDGKFSLEFVVPKDISFLKGFGKISSYADDESSNRDANGSEDSIVIGGSSPKPVTDNEGPVISLFMNDTNFIRGGLVNENPVLIARLSDDIGINTTGSGIGHDITMSLNGGQDVTLNRFYQAALNDYRRGEVRYPLHNLPDGSYSVTLKAWDVSNNSGTASTEFIVAASAKLALNRLLNFPNPVINNTRFHFEHNRPDDVLHVSIDIYSANGNHVKTLNADFGGDGSSANNIEWDGRGDNGSRIAQGVYIYTLTVKTSNGDIAQQSQKLVVIK